MLITCIVITLNMSPKLSLKIYELFSYDKIDGLDLDARQINKIPQEIPYGENACTQEYSR